MNQLHASGKSTYKSNLKKEFRLQKREVQQSNELSESEKEIKISTLENAFLKKKKRSDYFNF
jgi:hypothetical protein